MGGPPVRGHLQRWGAVYLVLLLFLGSLVGQFATQLLEFSSDQQAHHQPFEWADFFIAFGQATFENWQSEFLQLAIQATLLGAMGHVMFKAASRDQERMESKIDAIGRSVQALLERDDR